MALLLCVAMLSLGVVAAGVGGVVGETAANADMTRVVDAFDAAFAPTGPTGSAVVRVPVSTGRLHTVARDVRVLDANGTVRHYRSRAVVFDTGERGVTSVDGAVVVHGHGWAHVARPVRVTATPEAVVIDVVRVDGSIDVAGRGTPLSFRTNATSDRAAFGRGTYRLTVETRFPKAFERYYAAHEGPGTVLGERDYDGDGVPSVVIGFPPTARAYVVTRAVEVSG